MVIESIASGDRFLIGQDYCPNPFAFQQGQMVTILEGGGSALMRFTKGECCCEVLGVDPSRLLAALNAANAVKVEA